MDPKTSFYLLKKLYLCILLVTAGFLTTCCTSTKKIRAGNGIAKVEWLEIGKIKQYVLLRGENINNPVLLFLHGGPGAAATPLLRKYNQELEKYFTVVYWDQRGAGKSYQKSLTKEDIKVKAYISDTHELTEYLKRKFNKEKIYLIGHSWGARLGLRVIQEKPENYWAYLGVGQELQSYGGELLSYRYTLAKAIEQKNKKAIKELQATGEPSSGKYTEMYKTGFWGLVKQKEWLLQLGGERYGKTNYSDWVFSILFSKEYSFLDVIKYARASAFSAGNIIYDPDFNDVDFFTQVPKVAIPVYFISGEHDYNTPWTIVQEYYQQLKAPRKEFILFDYSGHSPVFEEPKRFNKEVVRLFLENEIEEHTKDEKIEK